MTEMNFWRVLGACFMLLPGSVFVFTIGTPSLLTAQAIPVCRSALSDTDGDSFGWEDNRSCRIVTGNHPRLTVCTRSDSDPDGDGFGWENNRSCIVGDSGSRQRPTCSSAAADPDGDGFGWENNQSCHVVDRSESPELLSEEKIAIRFPACSDTRFDPDVDGTAGKTVLPVAA